MVNRGCYKPSPLEHRVAIIVRWSLSRLAGGFGRDPEPPPWGRLWEGGRPGEGLNIQVGEMAVELVSVIRGLSFTIGLANVAVRLVP